MRFTVARIGFAASLLLTLGIAGWWYPQLPETVASHFGPGGVADGWMRKDSFFAIFLLLGVGSVAAVPLVGLVVGMLPTSLLNLPNKDYWLAPERREASMARLQSWLVEFGAVSMVLMAYILHITCQANVAEEAVLPDGFMRAMVVFLAYTVLWTVGLLWAWRVPR